LPVPGFESNDRVEIRHADRLSRHRQARGDDPSRGAGDDCRPLHFISRRQTARGKHRPIVVRHVPLHRGHLCRSASGEFSVNSTFGTAVDSLAARASDWPSSASRRPEVGVVLAIWGGWAEGRDAGRRESGEVRSFDGRLLVTRGRRRRELLGNRPYSRHARSVDVVCAPWMSRLPVGELVELPSASSVNRPGRTQCSSVATLSARRWMCW